jgi:hypothetical protein
LFLLTEFSADGLFPLTATVAIASKIVEERLPPRKDRGTALERSQVRNSATSARAAGRACTVRMRVLTVAAP